VFTFLSDNGAATRNLSDGFSRVWTTIYSIELETASGTKVKLFDSTQGVTLDLKVLNDGSVQNFVNLARRDIPAGTYTELEVQLSRDVTTFAFGSPTGLDMVYDTPFDDGANKSRVVVPLSGGLTLAAGARDLVVDFRLRGWTATGGRVTPLIAVGANTNLGTQNLHREWEYKGTVSNITGTAPNLQFTFTTAGGEVFTVKTNGSTSIFNESGQSGASLSANQVVEIRGQYQVADRSVLALVAKIEDGSDDDGNTEARGQSLSPDEVSGEFTLVIEEWESTVGYPSQDAVTVRTTTDTTFRDGNGAVITKAAAFQLLSGAGANSSVKVKGSFVRSSNVLTATVVELDSEGDSGESVFAIGTVFSVNRTAKTFTLTIDQSGGFPANPGDRVTVRTGNDTEFRDIFGNVLTETQYYNALSNGKDVYVEGRFENGEIRAIYADVDTEN
jgi:hypothetical protein